MSRQQLLKQLCAQAREFYERDWMLGTSGNLSAKLSDRPLTIAITASGKPKGGLTARDILIVDAHGRTKHGTPSAETAVHLALYRRLPSCGAVFHIHTLHSTVLASRLADDKRLNEIDISRLEMLKGFNQWAQDANVKLPIFPNWADVRRIAAMVDDYYRRPRALPGLLLAHHGLTAWGADLNEALKHTELVEFLCRYLWVLGTRPARRLTRQAPVLLSSQHGGR